MRSLLSQSVHRYEIPTSTRSLLTKMRFWAKLAKQPFSTPAQIPRVCRNTSPGSIRQPVGSDWRQKKQQPIAISLARPDLAHSGMIGRMKQPQFSLKSLFLLTAAVGCMLYFGSLAIRGKIAILNVAVLATVILVVFLVVRRYCETYKSSPPPLFQVPMKRENRNMLIWLALAGGVPAIFFVSRLI